MQVVLYQHILIKISLYLHTRNYYILNKNSHNNPKNNQKLFWPRVRMTIIIY